jgi:prophage antirepressor-like protein/DNA-binding Xre family transcriptional regulator
MNEMQLFTNEQFGTIRTVTQNDEPWFVAADLCKALDLTNTTVALERLADDEKSKFNLGLSGGETNVVNEYGMYALILGSRKPEAIQFQRWVTHDILPAIRKTGRYAAPGSMTASLADMREAMNLMQDMLTDLKQMLPKDGSMNRVLEAKANGTLEPRHFTHGRSFAHNLLDRNTIGKKITVYLIEEDVSTEQLAAELGVSSNTVFRWRRGQHAPTGWKLEKLCEVLGCQIEDLLR